MALDSIPVNPGLRGGPVYEVYNEAAFLHFLAAERRRAERSHRFLYLVLVMIKGGPGHSAKLTNDTSAALFQGLGASVREVDFVGWYQERQVPAAVLVQGGKPSDGGDVASIADRVRSELKKRLTATEFKHLRVRVVRLGGTTKVSFP